MLEIAVRTAGDERRETQMDAPGFVLIIEDDELVGPLLVSMLSTQGLLSRLCTEPAEARSLMRGAVAVVCDLYLKEESGFALIRRLRDAGFAGPIVAVSGSGDVDTVIQAAKAGADDFRGKPFSGPSLAATVKKLIAAKGQVASS